MMSKAKSTTGLLTKLRSFMRSTIHVSEPLNAYIVPSSDAHDSEYLAECDQRRSYISGFTGSAGTAVITLEQACLWTDGRYFLQASEEMDSNWTLMKEGVPDTPSQATWLSNTLPSGSVVGVDPQLLCYNKWVSLKDQLERIGHKLIPIDQNLVDLVWTDKPSVPCNPVKPLALKYTGKSIVDKLEIIRQKMNEKHASILVLTALDEIAWFLNLRGSDIEFNPVFFAFVIIYPESFTVFIDPKKYVPEVIAHLTKESGVGTFKMEGYGEIKEVLKASLEGLQGQVWIAPNANYALTSVLPANRIVHEITPIQLMKAVKNSVEIQGMRNAHIKDAAALCCYFDWVERNLSSGTITEITGANKLKGFRAQQADFIGCSFDTISSVGPHGAIIHYKPTESTDVPLRDDCIYLCDSGGQYLDGTTDITRTMHFGTPTDYEKDCFTRVLKGQIKLATSVFPTKIKGNCLDSFAREFLWEVGLDYAHGTGHGIGSYLNVHEGPMGVSWREMPNDPGLEAGMFISNEPGYYEDGKFGLRIEDIVQIVEANPPHNHKNRGFLTFETISLVPIQLKMMDFDMMTDKEIAHINNYHQRCRDIIGPILDSQGLTEAKAWLWKESIQIVKSGTCSSNVSVDKCPKVQTTV